MKLTIDRVVAYMKERYPDKRIKGYWIFDDAIVIKAESGLEEMLREPVLFEFKDNEAMRPVQRNIDLF